MVSFLVPEQGFWKNNIFHVRGQFHWAGSAAGLLPTCDVEMFKTAQITQPILHEMFLLLGISLD